MAVPFERTDAERSKAEVDRTPWWERAIALQQPNADAGADPTLIAEGTLLEVAVALADRTPADLRKARIVLPDRRRAGRTYDGPALVNLIARARVLVERPSIA